MGFHTGKSIATLDHHGHNYTCRTEATLSCVDCEGAVAMPGPVRMIAAMARNGVMGKDGKLPWSIPEEQQTGVRVSVDNIYIYKTLVDRSRFTENDLWMIWDEPTCGKPRANNDGLNHFRTLWT